MVERFRPQDGKEYPGKATVIFYMNDGNDPEEKALFYMEAEMNSPMVRLEPGDTYAMDTEWFPTRAGGDLVGVTAAGVIRERLRVSAANRVRWMTGTFGVFFQGRIVARFFDAQDRQLSEIRLKRVAPQDPVTLNEKIRLPKNASRLTLHLIDLKGRERGALDEISLGPGGAE
jgi:hypothetical protein